MIDSLTKTKPRLDGLTVYSIITPFGAFEIYCIWKNMENGAFAPIIHNILKSIQNFT